MKKLIIILSVTMLSTSAFAEFDFDLNGFKADLEKTVKITRVMFECSSNIDELDRMHKHANTVAGVYGVEESLPLKSEICKNSIENAIAEGITPQEIQKALEKVKEAQEL